MAKDGLPINPEVLAWARQRAGLNLDAAVEKFSHFAEWESGSALPSYSQLERLADELKVPIAVFFFPEPPKLPSIRESFRTLPDTEFDHMPRRVQYLLRKAKAFQLNLPELTQGRNPAPRLITRDLDFVPTVSLDTMAAKVRAFLGIDVAEQMAWKDEDTALKNWRKSLQSVGVFVFKDAFKAENYSGFSLYDAEFPIVFVNNSSTKTRQMFTLFHELAHLLFHTSGIDTSHDDDYLPALPAEQRRIEVLCNSFAARFLVPSTEFETFSRRFGHSEEAAERIAAHFHVSREVIFRIFLDRNWITQSAYAQATMKWSAQRQAASEGGSSGGNPYWTKISYLGMDYMRLAFSQYHQNRIDDVQLAEYLDTKPKNLSSLEDYFSRAPQ